MPEIVGGALGKFFDDICGLSSGVIMTTICRGLGGPDRANILQGFELGKEHLKAQLRIKTGQFEVLPLYQMIIGHPEEEEARFGAAKALAM